MLLFHPGTLGDMMILYPTLVALKRDFGAQVFAVAGGGAPGLLHECGILEKIISIDSTSVSGLFTENPGLSNEFADFIRDFEIAGVFLGKSADNLVKNLEHAGIRKVFRGSTRPPDGTKQNVYEHIAGCFGIPGLKPLNERLALNNSKLEQAQKYLKSLGISSRKGIAIHPGSGSKSKNWAPEKFGELIKGLARKNADFFIIEGPAEEGIADKISRAAGIEGIKVARPSSVSDLAGVIALSRRYIGNDSGVTHLAAALGVNTTAIFTITDPGIWARKAKNALVLLNPSVDEVLSNLT